MKINGYDTGSDVTLIFVAGHGKPWKEEKHFEWENSTRDFKENRLFVGHVQRAWYHDCFKRLLPFLKEKTQGKKVLTVGVSMGGYGALVIADYLKCGSLTFAPQTNIKVDFLKAHDPRYLKNCEVINSLTSFPECLDLSFIAGQQHHIYYSSDVPEDVCHAKNLDVSHFPQKHHDHNVAGYLKGQGKLVRILRNRIEGICRH